MSGTVPVIDVIRPEGGARDRVQQRRQNTFRKTGPGQCNHTFEHAGAVLFLFSTDLPHRHHPRDIRCATQILPTRVNQEQAITLDHSMFLLGRMVMRHRTICVKCRNGIEAQ